MYFQLILVVSWICAASCSPYLREWPKVLTVTAENQHELGLPLGTKLKKDKRTKLYIPPPINDDFTPEDRLVLQFTNKTTARNYCKVGPDVDEGIRRLRNFALTAQWCRSSDGEDICCGAKRCSCDLVSRNCGCISKEAYDYFEQKKQKDFDNTLHAIDTVSNAVGKIAAGAAATGK